jgi:ribokinase
MAQILNFGSINVDHVYQVPHFVQPAETLAATDYAKGLGGKGFNQSVALHRAGVEVLHVGNIGRDDTWTQAQISATGLSLRGIGATDAATGHALIQVNAQAENCILLCAGANAQLTQAQLSQHLAQDAAQWVLLQNETNLIADIIEQSHAAGKHVVFNPAPCHAGMADLPLELLHTVVVNEVEAAQLTGMHDVEQALVALQQRVKNVVLTMGGQGARYLGESGAFFVPANPVQAVDTTAAGDTFIGFYLSVIIQGGSVEAALTCATQAAGIAVTRMGATASIPFIHELAQ